MRVRRLNAYTAYLVLLNGAAPLIFALMATMNLVYQVETVRLNPLQLVLVGTVLEATAFLCEIPTGVVADLYSRRLSLVIGTLLIGAGFLLEGLVPRFEAVLLAQVIWGLGATFQSGAEQAWIAGEVGEERLSHAFMRGAQVGQFAGVAGILLSIPLVTIQPNVPVVVGGALYMVLGVVLALLLPEHGFTRAQQGERASWRSFGATLADGGRLVRARPVVLTLLLVAAAYGMASEGFDRLWGAHLLTDFHLPPLATFAPLTWFGALPIGAMLLTALATEGVRRAVDTTQPHRLARVLLLLGVVQCGAALVFALSGQFALAVVAWLAVRAVRGTAQPLYMSWLAQSTEPRVRATVISMSGQMDALGQIAGGPVIGVLGTAVTLRAALAATAAALTPALILYARMVRAPRTIAAALGDGTVSHEALVDVPDASTGRGA